MKKLLVTLLIVLGWAGNAHAKVHVYDFTAVLEKASSAESSGWSSSADGIAFGKTVNAGDKITGRISYDDAAPPTSYWSLGVTAYYPGVPSKNFFLQYAFERTGQSFMSDTASVDVWNDNNYEQRDSFIVMAAMGSHWRSYQSASLLLFDSDRTVFSDAFLPTSLRLEDFEHAKLYAEWPPVFGGRTTVAWADITSLTPTSPVPEPAGAVLVLTGLVVGGLVARRAV